MRSALFKNLLSWLLFATNPGFLLAQSFSQTDSLKATLDLQQNDSAKCAILYSLAFKYRQIDLDSSRYFADRCMELAREINSDYFQEKAFSAYGLVALISGEYELAKHYFDSSLNRAIINNHYDVISAAYTNLGVLEKQKGNYEEAISYYLEGLARDEANEYVWGMAFKQGNIGNIYSQMGDFANALKYFRLALKSHKNNNNLNGEALMYNNMALSFMDLKDYDSARICLLNSLEINRKTGNLGEVSRNLNNLGALSREEGDYFQAIAYDKEALALREQVGDKYEISVTLGALGSDYSFMGDLTRGMEYFNRALKLSLELKAPYIVMDQYLALAQAHEKNNRFAESAAYYKQFIALKDSLINAERIAQVEELNTKYKTEKKDREIVQQKLFLNQQEQQLRRQQITIAFVIIFLMAVLVILLLVLRYQRIKKKADQQRILALQKEHEVKTIKAMVAGEEKERSRIARELHDGVAGTLAAIKLRLNHADNSGELDESISLLEEVSKEVRQISHNLMPETLRKNGLIDSLQSYLAYIQSTGGMDVDFQVFGWDTGTSDELELLVYRIVQELVGNAVKHANATELIVQLSKTAELLTITVEDDGKGFDLDRKGNGMGLEGIRSRLNYINGSLDIVSKPGKGTSVYIEIMSVETAQ